MVGETVGPQLTGVANVAEIADFSSIVVETDVPEARLGLVAVGAPAEIVLDAYPTRRYRGTTVDIGKRVNRAKATVVVKVRFKDTLDGVLPDMSARVSFLREELKQHVVKEIGSIARPDEIRFADALPKTRSGKIMRRLLRDIASGKETLGDTTTLEDYSVLAKLREEEQ